MPLCPHLTITLIEWIVLCFHNGVHKPRIYRPIYSMQLAQVDLLATSPKTYCDQSDHVIAIRLQLRIRPNIQLDLRQNIRLWPKVHCDIRPHIRFRPKLQFAYSVDLYRRSPPTFPPPLTVGIQQISQI